MAATLTTCVDRGPDWTKTQIIQIICLMNNTNKYIIVETWMKRLTLETNYHSKLRQGLNKHLNKKLVVPHKLPAKDRAIHYMVFLSSVVEIHVILPTHTPCFSNSMFCWRIVSFWYSSHGKILICISLALQKNKQITLILVQAFPIWTYPIGCTIFQWWNNYFERKNKVKL